MRSRPLHAPARRFSLLVAGIGVLAVLSQSISWAFSGSGGAIAWAETERISDGAAASASDRVDVGGTVKISGTGWTSLAGTGSVIAVRLDDGDARQTVPVVNPATGNALTDPSVYAAVQAGRKGGFSIDLAIPVGREWTAGSRHSVRLVTGRLLSDDATRSVTLTFDLVSAPSSKTTGPDPSRSASTSASTPPASDVPITSTPPATERNPAELGGSSASPSASGPTSKPFTAQSPASNPQLPVSPRQGAATAAPRTDRLSAGSPNLLGSSERPAVSSPCQQKPGVALSSPSSTRGVPSVEPGGRLTLTGTGFCRPGGGGSLIAIQIDGGAFQRLDHKVHTDRKVWQIVDADADGRFAVSIPVPGDDDTQPTFTDGLHRLRLVTGKLRAGDAARSLETTEFVVGAGNHAGVLPEPTSAPSPVEPALALVGANGGAVTMTRSGSAVRLVVPELEPGDWVFPYVFDGDVLKSTRAQPASWAQLDADRSIVMDVGDLAGVGSQTRISLQARDGMLVGWAPMSAVDSETLDATQPAEPATDRGHELETADSPHAARPLVLLAGVAALLIGLAWTVGARQRRIRRLQALNRR